MENNSTDDVGQSDPNQSAPDQSEEASSPNISSDKDAAIGHFAKKIRRELGAVFVPSPDGVMHTFRDPSEEAFNQNGWYCFDKTANAAVFGSIGCGDVWHWHSEQFSALSEKERHVINDLMREACERKTVAGDCKGDVAISPMQGVSIKEDAIAEPNDGQLQNTRPQPIPLVSTLPPVKPFVLSMLPDSIGGFVGDTSARLQVSPDYLAVGALATIAGLVGSKKRICPKQQDNWAVTPTVWAAMIGAPSSMKSPCLSAVLQPVYAIEKELAKAHENALAFHGCASELAEVNLKSVKQEAAKKFKDDEAAGVKMVQEATFSAKPPVRQRYILNDATVEMCAVLLSENPTGMLLVRDEMSGFLDKVSKEEFQVDRAFYMECFEGNNPFTCDRIGRGTTVIKNCVLSMIGGIQPSRIAPLIRSAMEGKLDDGLAQRLQCAVWPDEQKVWKWTDRAPDEKAAAEYTRVLREMHDLPRPMEDETPAHMRFSPEAQPLYIKWIEQLHAKVRSGDLHPVMQSHLLKMQKTIPTLALLFELVDGGRVEVGIKSTVRALAWADYLESHAMRLYSLASNRAMDAAKLILRRQDKLQGPFTAREIQRAGWAGLSSVQDVTDALELLVDHRYLAESTKLPGSSGGRPKTEYRWHPSLAKKS